jgi:hypothetical protein
MSSIITAGTTRTQAGATQITADVTTVNTSTAVSGGTLVGDGVCLPQTGSGTDVVFLINNTANPIQLYGFKDPNGSYESINGISGSQGIAISPYSTAQRYVASGRVQHQLDCGRRDPDRCQHCGRWLVGRSGVDRHAYWRGRDHATDRCGTGAFAVLAFGRYDVPPAHHQRVEWRLCLDCDNQYWLDPHRHDVDRTEHVARVRRDHHRRWCKPDCDAAVSGSRHLQLINPPCSCPWGVLRGALFYSR